MKSRKNEKKQNPHDKAIAFGEIQSLLESFFLTHLSENYFIYCLNLGQRIQRKRSLSFDRGKKEIWAAAIVITIARLNFLFDPYNDNHINHDTICDFFGVKKSTAGNKASHIADVLDLGYGEEDLSDPHIIDSLSFIQFSNGIILPKAMITETPEVRERKEEKRRKRMEEKERQRKEKQEAKKREKRKIEEKYQPNLFDEM